MVWFVPAVKFVVSVRAWILARLSPAIPVKFASMAFVRTIVHVSVAQRDKRVNPMVGASLTLALENNAMPANIAMRAVPA